MSIDNTAFIFTNAISAQMVYANFTRHFVCTVVTQTRTTEAYSSTMTRPNGKSVRAN